MGFGWYHNPLISIFILAKQHQTMIVPIENKYKTIFYLKTMPRILIPCFPVQTLSTCQTNIKSPASPFSQGFHLLTEKYNKTIPNYHFMVALSSPFELLTHNSSLHGSTKPFPPIWMTWSLCAWSYECADWNFQNSHAQLCTTAGQAFMHRSLLGHL